jgi:hypothetical protein
MSRILKCVLVLACTMLGSFSDLVGAGELRGFLRSHQLVGLEDGVARASKHDPSLGAFNAAGLFVVTTGNCFSDINSLQLFQYDSPLQEMTLKLGQCSPDPTGLAVSVEAIADELGNVVVSSFNDTQCHSLLTRRYIDHSLMELCRRSESFPEMNVTYRIQTSPVPSPVLLNKRYYFSESCSGPYSQVSTYGCWNDHFAGRSVYTEFYVRQPRINSTINLAYLVEFNALNCKGVGKWYGAHNEDPADDLPGYAKCTKEEDHYVYTILGSDVEVQLPSSSYQAK